MKRVDWIEGETVKKPRQRNAFENAVAKVIDATEQMEDKLKKGKVDFWASELGQQSLRIPEENRQREIRLEKKNERVSKSRGNRVSQTSQGCR